MVFAPPVCGCVLSVGLPNPFRNATAQDAHLEGTPSPPLPDSTPRVSGNDVELTSLAFCLRNPAFFSRHSGIVHPPS